VRSIASAISWRLKPRARSALRVATIRVSVAKRFWPKCVKVKSGASPEISMQYLAALRRRNRLRCARSLVAVDCADHLRIAPSGFYRSR